MQGGAAAGVGWGGAHRELHPSIQNDGANATDGCPLTSLGAYGLEKGCGLGWVLDRPSFLPRACTFCVHLRNSWNGDQEVIIQVSLDQIRVLQVLTS